MDSNNYIFGCLIWLSLARSRTHQRQEIPLRRHVEFRAAAFRRGLLQQPVEGGWGILHEVGGENDRKLHRRGELQGHRDIGARRLICTFVIKRRGTRGSVDRSRESHLGLVALPRRFGDLHRCGVALLVVLEHVERKRFICWLELFWKLHREPIAGDDRLVLARTEGGCRRGLICARGRIRARIADPS